MAETDIFDRYQESDLDDEDQWTDLELLDEVNTLIHKAFNEGKRKIAFIMCDEYGLPLVRGKSINFFYNK